MVESLSIFPFQKLRFNKYITLEVMMYVEYLEVYKFMFTLNRDTRSYLRNNFNIVQNGFINEGLITFKFNNDFHHYYLLEKLYF